MCDENVNDKFRKPNFPVKVDVRDYRVLFDLTSLDVHDDFLSPSVNPSVLGRNIHDLFVLIALASSIFSEKFSP
jgi:hypothetical protein